MGYSLVGQLFLYCPPIKYKNANKVEIIYKKALTIVNM